MRHSVSCYPIPGKRKALRLCEAFAEGVSRAGGIARVITKIPDILEDGAAVFYGVRPSVAHLWRQAKAERREWFYIDNSYFDCAREQQFRVTRNRIQHTGQGESDGTRFKKLGIRIKPLKVGGEYTLVCQQSREFMQVVAGDPFWIDRAVRDLSGMLVVRAKGECRSFADDLVGASRVVAYSSATAIEATLAGIPVICSEQCAAYMPGDRRRWASVLADNQFSVEEFANGYAWNQLERAGSFSTAKMATGL